MTDKERELVNGFGKIGGESGRQGGGGGCLGQFVFYSLFLGKLWTSS